MEHGASAILPLDDVVAALQELALTPRASAQNGTPVSLPDLPALPAPALGLPVLRGPGGPPPGWTPPRAGCHRLEFTPDPTNLDPLTWPAALGTLRVEWVGDRTLVASADLYRAAECLPALPAGQRTPADRTLPCYPRSAYHAYLRVDSPFTAALAPAGRLRRSGAPALPATMHRLVQLETGVWAPPEQVELWWAGEGRVEIRTPLDGRPLGQLHLEWVSEFFREATIELDAEPGLPVPLEGAGGEDWATAFARAGWKVRVETGPLEVRPPAAGAWSVADLHAALLKSRREVDLDREWHYHVSLVRWFAGEASPIGLAFDHEAGDFNRVPREGVAVAAGARLPAQREYGAYAGRVLADCPEVLFRVALHEIGHALGLYHNDAAHGVMQPIDELAETIPGGSLDDDALRPRFAADDIVRLRHLPDIQVRPGGTDWETADHVDDHDHLPTAEPRIVAASPGEEEARGWELSVVPVEDALPLGAPVRLDLELSNAFPVPRAAPARLSLATPHLRGWVVSPDGTEEFFRSLFHASWVGNVQEVAPGDSRRGSVTLLRGLRRPLFPRPGRHRVWVEVVWMAAGAERVVRRRVEVEVLPPNGASEAAAARHLLATPETLGALAIGSSPAFQRGERAMARGLDEERLRPHFAYLRARNLLEAAAHDPCAQDEARGLLKPAEHERVLNRRERLRAVELRTVCGLPHP